MEIRRTLWLPRLPLYNPGRGATSAAATHIPVKRSSEHPCRWLPVPGYGLKPMRHMRRSHMSHGKRGGGQKIALPKANWIAFGSAQVEIPDTGPVTPEGSDRSSCASVERVHHQPMEVHVLLATVRAKDLDLALLSKVQERRQQVFVELQVARRVAMVKTVQ